jgi:pimeloyl-ACP methyl ester carboxylesterase
MKVIVKGITLGFELLGQGKMPLVLIHGFGLDRSIWVEMVQKYLSDQFVLLPDVRGHGESEVNNDPISISLWVEDLVRLLDYLQIEKVVVCGHSMGGYIALAFAEQFPERLAGLGLITSRADADSEEQKAGRYRLVESVKEKGSKALAESLAPKLSKDPNVINHSYRLITQTSSQGIISAALAMADRPNRTELLAKIILPALVVAGAEDQIIDLDKAEKMAGLLPKGELLIIPDAGHMPMLEKPETLSGDLLTLILRVHNQ